MVRLLPGHRLDAPRGGPALLGDGPWTVTMGGPALEPIEWDFAAPAGTGTFAAGWPSEVGVDEVYIDDSILALSADLIQVTIPANSYYDVAPAIPGQAIFTDHRISLNQRGDTEGELSYRIRFEDGFGFGMGGKIPGLAGGGDNGGGADLYDGEAGWSARLMWHGANEGPSGLTYPHLKIYYYGRDRFDDAGTELQSHGVSYFAETEIQAGEWYDVRLRVRVNDVGVANGSIRLWINNVLLVDESGLRITGAYEPLIEYLMFDIFRGGSDSSWASASDGTISIADVRYRTIEVGADAVAPEAAPAAVTAFDPLDWAGTSWPGTGTAAFTLAQGGTGNDATSGTDDYGPYVEQTGKKLRNAAVSIGATFSIVGLFQIRDQTEGNTIVLNFGTEGSLQVRDSYQTRLSFRESGNLDSPLRMISPGRIVSLALSVDDAAKTARLYRDGVLLTEIDTTAMTADVITLFELGQAPLGMRTYGLRIYDAALSPGEIVGAVNDMRGG